MFLHVLCVGVSLSFPALPQCPLSCVCVCVCVCPQVGGVPPGEMNGLELEFLFSINFSMAVSTEVYAKYNAELVAHVNKPSAGHSCPCRARAHTHTLLYCVCDVARWRAFVCVVVACVASVAHCCIACTLLPSVCPYPPTDARVCVSVPLPPSAGVFASAGVTFAIPPLPKRLPSPDEPGLGYDPTAKSRYAQVEVFIEDCFTAEGGIVYPDADM